MPSPQLRSCGRTNGPTDGATGAGPPRTRRLGSSRGPPALAYLPTSFNSNLFLFFGKDRGGWSRGGEKSGLGIFSPLFSNLREAASSPLKKKKKSHQKKKKKERCRTPERARPDPQRPPPGAQDGWALREVARPAGSARPCRRGLAPTTAQNLPGRSRGREEKKVGGWGKGRGGEGEGRAGGWGGEGREPSLLFISS